VGGNLNFVDHSASLKRGKAALRVFRDGGGVAAQMRTPGDSGGLGRGPVLSLIEVASLVVGLR
jgi:hypothetical protein